MKLSCGKDQTEERNTEMKNWPHKWEELVKSYFIVHETDKYNSFYKDISQFLYKKYWTYKKRICYH